MHLNQITSPQPQQQKLEFRLNCDRQSADCEALFTAENYAFSAENEKNENEKYIFGRKRKCPKPSKIAIFGAENENENEFRSVSSYNFPKPELIWMKPGI